MNSPASQTPRPRDLGWIDRVLWFSLNNKLAIALLIVFFAVWGIMVAPFDWDTGALPRSPVPVDAIPDLGENQQIVFTDWPGRSPQDVEDQITYPLTAALLGVPFAIISGGLATIVLTGYIAWKYPKLRDYTRAHMAEDRARAAAV